MKIDSTNFKFFQHQKCEYFPCHQINNQENFNCLFCYCPLYALGENCGGNFTYTQKGVKNCSSCNYPHLKENYDGVLEKLSKLIEQLKTTKI
ncbi:cysteine-rich small domain-containing protein [Acetobacterium woodii]|uniref:cysteine-rich small domain-containing protein n=1 Tax=Acetobacterium woodii TaxID=33952 RepID=UPI0002E8F7FA|nr:cysteine-rich small domain-containing protein [Acetobacterium woodii]